MPYHATTTEIATDLTDAPSLPPSPPPPRPSPPPQPALPLYPALPLPGVSGVNSPFGFDQIWRMYRALNDDNIPFVSFPLSQDKSAFYSHRQVRPPQHVLGLM